jgi:hypothetical protein
MFRPAIRRTMLDRALLLVVAVLLVFLGLLTWRDMKAGRVTPSIFMPQDPPQ